MVRYLADRILVMYPGQIMEQGTTEQIFSPPYQSILDEETLQAMKPVIRIKDKRAEDAAL